MKGIRGHEEEEQQPREWDEWQQGEALGVDSDDDDDDDDPSRRKRKAIHSINNKVETCLLEWGCFVFFLFQRGLSGLC